MIIPASNRQLKMMRFFGAPVAEGISADVARRVISDMLADPANRERWDKYVYLTHDFSSESAYPTPFDSAGLKGIVVPQGRRSAGVTLASSARSGAGIRHVTMIWGTPDGGKTYADYASRYRIYAGRERVGVVTETLDGVQIETSDLILRVELEELLSNPTAERTGGTFGNILWDGVGPTLHPGDPGHVRVALQWGGVVALERGSRTSCTCSG